MNELIAQIVGALGLNEGQAKGALGLIFKLLRGKVDGGVFAQVKKALPDVDEAIDAAPTPGGLGGMLGGLASSLGGQSAGDLAELASGFKDLDLDLGQLDDILGQIKDFLTQSGKGDVVDLVMNALKK